MTKNLWAMAFGVLVGILATGAILLASRPPRGKPVLLLPPPTPAPIVVHVAGGVAQPGVYPLPVGSRLIDAIEAAGGFLPQADSSNLNLALPLVDGQKIEIPLHSPTAIPQISQLSSPPFEPSGVQNPTATASSLININTASQAELETLPGVGPKIAQNILAYRDANGPFHSVEQIQLVDGIGPALFAKIKDLITVGSSP